MPTIPILGNHLTQCFTHYFQKIHGRNCRLASVVFNDSFYINPVQLLEKLRANLSAKCPHLEFKQGALQKAMQTKNGIQLYLKNMGISRCSHLTIASGHYSAQLASKSGMRMKTQSSFVYWAGFAHKSLTGPLQRLCKQLKRSLLVKFSGRALLLHPYTTPNSLALQMADASKKPCWRGVVENNKEYQKEMEETVAEKNNKKKNPGEGKAKTIANKKAMQNLERTWQQLFKSSMPTPQILQGGYRTRAENWLPQLGTLPFIENAQGAPKNFAKTIGEENMFLISSFYKSGITMAPLITALSYNLFSSRYATRNKNNRGELLRKSYRPPFQIQNIHGLNFNALLNPNLSLENEIFMRKAFMEGSAIVNPPFKKSKQTYTKNHDSNGKKHNNNTKKYKKKRKNNKVMPYPALATKEGKNYRWGASVLNYPFH